MTSTLDIVSEGRVELGTGESAFATELWGYGFSAPDHKVRDETHAAWEETTEDVVKMMTMEPYPGFDGEYFSMPARNVIPKPVQDSHPPLWVAVTNKETLRLAARMGIGALVITDVKPENADEWVDLYRETLKNECIPIGKEVNPNVLFVMMGFGVAHDEDEAYRRGEEAARFFAFSASHYGSSVHIPGYTNLWEEYLEKKDDVDMRRNAIGTPEQLSEMFWTYMENGVDEIAMLMLAGVSEHEDICDGLKIVADEVMPSLHEVHEEQQRQKMDELEPYIQQAFDRKPDIEPPKIDDIDPVLPLGRTFDIDEAVDHLLDPVDAPWRQIWKSYFGENKD
jgi:alkanesulfonate monooxygenase SsuD/methylene tetrahydromethanopterin reductase-like flavin-dependent oxidoreductase (luciferase family)